MEGPGVTVIRPPAMTLDRLWTSILRLPQYGDLLLALTAHRLKVRYKQSALGPLWALLQPVAMMVTFVAIFSVITRMPSNGHPYALFAYAGLLPWTAFATALGSGATSLVAHPALVTRVYFPREILPLTYVAAALVDLVVASSVLGVLMVWYGVPLTPAVLWTLPVLVLLAALALAGSLVLSAVNVRYRDVGIAMPLLLQVWMFASAVIYPLRAVPDEWRPWVVLNPMVGIIDGFRRAVLEGTAPEPVAFASAGVIVAVALPAAYLWFKHVEATVADMI